MSSMSKSPTTTERRIGDHDRWIEVDMTIAPRQAIAVHPGEILQELLDQNRSPNPWSLSAWAWRSPRSATLPRQAGRDARHGHALGPAVGQSPRFWLNLQENWELSHWTKRSTWVSSRFISPWQRNDGGGHVFAVFGGDALRRGDDAVRRRRSRQAKHACARHQRATKFMLSPVLAVVGAGGSERR